MGGHILDGYIITNVQVMQITEEKENSYAMYKKMKLEYF